MGNDNRKDSVQRFFDGADYWIGREQSEPSHIDSKVCKRTCAEDFFDLYRERASKEADVQVRCVRAGNCVGKAECKAKVIRFHIVFL